VPQDFLLSKQVKRSSAEVLEHKADILGFRNYQITKAKYLASKGVFSLVSHFHIPQEIAGKLKKQNCKQMLDHNILTQL